MVPRRALAASRPAGGAPFTLAADEVLSSLGSSRRGLGLEEARRKLGEDGPNVLPEPPLTGIATVFLRQFASPFIYVLLVAAVLSVALREWSDAAFIGLVVVLNAAIGTVQEARAERSAHALRQMMTTSARVVRGGDVAEIDAAGIVRGDVVLLASGDKVPADLRLLDAQDLRVDESLLTGESLPVAKAPEAMLPPDAGLGDRVNMTFAGALVTRGRAEGVVVGTGLGTEIGALASEIGGLSGQEPPLLTRMRRFTHWVSTVMVVVAVAFGALEAARGTPLSEVALVVIALAVSAIPEGLPVALTVALAIGMRRMAARHVIVRRMAAVESLGSCTAIASDKTGTITVNELTATDVVLPGGARWAVSGAGTVPEGAAAPVDPGDGSRRAQVVRLARAGVLCNEAVLAREDTRWVHHGDAVDVSLLVLAHKLGVTRPEALAEAPLLAQIPFEPERRFAASLHAIDAVGGDPPALFVKGAAETVLAMCACQLGPDGDEPLDAAAALDAAEQLAGEGRRVLALASSPLPVGAGAGRLFEEHLRELVFLGLVGMLDPPRTGAREAVGACASAGLRVLMVTGDHPTTALAVARAVGIAAVGDRAVTGHELRAVAAGGDGLGALDELVARTRVFARVEPSQKLDIVASLVRQGELVAVTGDGANDAPALRQAHVGVAMGRGGTDVAREAADLIVTDDDFSSIVAGIEEGRVAYGNVRKVISLLVSTGAAELVLFLLALGSGMAAPLTAVQLLWLNLVTNGIQDVALAFEPKEGGEMRRPPRPPAEGVFNHLMLARIAAASATMGVAAFVLYRALVDAGWALGPARNAVVLVMVLFENVTVLNSRSETESFLRIRFRGNRLLVLGTLAAFGAHVTAMHWTPTQDLLQIGPLPAAVWGGTLLAALVLLAVVEIEKALWRATSRRSPPRRRRGEGRSAP